MDTMTSAMSATQIEATRSELASIGYTILPADAIVSEQTRRAIADAAFTPARLERDLPHVHPCRERADDLVHFRWDNDLLHLSEAPVNAEDPSRIDVQLTRNFSTARQYPRFLALSSDPLRMLVDAVLKLVPRDQRRVAGCVGIHAVKTHGVVVPVWHRDGNRKSPVDWVISYVVARTGDGAYSQLAKDRRGRELVVEWQLSPGQLLMHRDDCYYHYVTPTEATPEGTAERAAIIMMIRPPLLVGAVAEEPSHLSTPASSR